MIKERRFTTPLRIREMCCRENWYTEGDIEEYTEMLKMVDSRYEMNTDRIVKVAEDIKKHSERREEIEDICIEIAKNCYTTFYDEEE